jgi:hypothetical protein
MKMRELCCAKNVLTRRRLKHEPRLPRGLAGCLHDQRQAGKIDHSLRELLAQRIFAIACGYPDANDSARLSSDPIHKMLLDRDPVTGRDLASQPTLSRFENAVGPKELYRMAEVLALRVVERHAERLHGRVRRVTLDLDPTDDPTHGAQQLSFSTPLRLPLLPAGAGLFSVSTTSRSSICSPPCCELATSLPPSERSACCAD